MNNMPLIKLRVLRVALFGYVSVVAMDVTTTLKFEGDPVTIQMLVLGLLSLATMTISARDPRKRRSNPLSDLVSEDGGYRLVQQPDGGLTLYRTPEAHPLWSSKRKTRKKCGAEASGKTSPRYIVFVCE
ncbi:hypothetical protein ACXYTJ_15910 [Gilvimarinus sp. F26214L]|uniref:hypothetical protein n=1 Tax=Gilvimarinus sp. DZF01 TaxID=3461371 RepID=UPI004045BA5B